MARAGWLGEESGANMYYSMEAQLSIHHALSTGAMLGLHLDYFLSQGRQFRVLSDAGFPMGLAFVM